MPLSVSSRWRLRPLRPGRRTSRTRQLGISGSFASRSSCPDPKVWQLSPTASISSLIAVRIDGSSSITKTIWSAFFMSTLAAQWKGKLYCRSFVLVLCSPKRSPVGLDDRSTNREPQAHASWFSGKKRVEDQVDILGVEAIASVPHCNYDLIRPTLPGANQQLTRMRLHPAHSLFAV